MTAQNTAITDQLSELSIMDGEFQSGSAAFEMLNDHEKNFAPKTDDSLPSVFDHPLNCSDWTLRLSQSSLLQPVTGSSGKTCAQHVDEYMRLRSQPLGDISKNASNRYVNNEVESEPHFDMSFESPWTYRSPVPCYKPANGNWKSIDTDSSTSFDFSSENSTLNTTMTPPFGDTDDQDVIHGNLTSADFTRVSGSLTALSSSTNHLPVRSLSSVASDSLKSGASGLYGVNENQNKMESAVDDFRMKSTLGKENVRPSVEVPLKRPKNGADKSTSRSCYASTVPSSVGLESDGSVASYLSSLSNNSQSALKTKDLGVQMVTKENLNYSVSKAISDSDLKKLAKKSKSSGLPISHKTPSSGEQGDSNLEKQTSSSKVVDGKYYRSSSTPIKDLPQQESGKVQGERAKNVPDHATAVSHHWADRLSGASSLSTGLLTDSSIVEDVDETVQLPLPPRLTPRQVQGLAKETCKTMIAATQTSMLSDRDIGFSSKKDASPSQLLSKTADGYQYRSGPYLLVPQELRFEGVCCVGLSAHGTLLVNNPTSKWQSVKVAIKQFTVDTRAEDPNSCPFTARSKFTIDPNSSETIKVLFAPRIAGVYVAQLTLLSSLAMAGRPPIMITLQAVAESPKVELVAGSRSTAQELHFRPLPWGCETYEYISLVNRGRATIPIRLVISSSLPNCYVFDKRTACVNRSTESLGRFSSPDAARERLVMPMLHTCVMLGGDADGAERHRQIPVYFRAPKRSSSKGYGHIEEITGSIKAEIDVPTSHSRLIATLSVFGTVGTAKLHIPKYIEPMMFTTGRTQAIQIPLRNSGDILLNIDLSFSDRSDLFTVRPSEVALDPGSEQTITVSFAARVGSMESRFESFLFMRVKPDGPVYEVKLVTIRAESLSSSNNPTVMRDANSQTLDQAKGMSSSFFTTTIRGDRFQTLDPGVSRDTDDFLCSYKNLAQTYPLDRPRSEGEQRKAMSSKLKEPVSVSKPTSAATIPSKLQASRTTPSSSSSSIERLPTAARDSPIVTVKVPVMTSSDADPRMSKQCLRFPSCGVGSVVELPLEFTNECSHMVKWSVAHCAPAYVKRSAHETCESLRYSVFQWSDQNGCIPTAAIEKVMVSFCPKEIGHYSQLYEVQFHELNSQDPLRHTFQVEMFGLTTSESGKRSDARLNGSVSDCTQSTTTVRTSPLDGTVFRMRSNDGMLTIEPNRMLFNQISRFETQTCKLELKNRGSNTYKVELSEVALPFCINHKSLTLRARHYLRVPVEFKPKAVGSYSSEVTVRTDSGDNFTVRLHGVCVQ